MKPGEVSILYCAICDLAIARGAKPKTVWQGAVDDYVFWLNASERDTLVDGCMQLPRFGIYIKRAGWPMGIVDPTGGALIGLGWGDKPGEIEDELIRVVKEATKEGVE